MKSLTGLAGMIAGGCMIWQGLSAQTESAIHQIWQNQLTVGGVQTVLLAAITFNTKRKEDDLPVSASDDERSDGF